MPSINQLPRATAVLEQGMADRLHIGAQAYASVNGQIVADFALGESRAGVPMTTDTLMLWLSAGKPVTAVAIAQQWEQGRLRLDDRVADHLPGFGVNGKQTITIRHLLTHTGGFRWVDTGWPGTPWEQIIERISDAPQERGWIAGHKAGYSPSVSWFVLGEIVRRLDGRDIARYAREELFVPLGMRDSWLALPVEAYRRYGDRIGILQKTDKPALAEAGFDTEQAAGNCRPGGSARGPIRELGRFYEMLLGGGTLDGMRVLSEQAVEAITAPHRVGMYDVTFGHVIDWGLGFIVNSAAPHSTPASAGGVASFPYGYGPFGSHRTYGHGGAQSSTAFADPARGLVVAIVCNGQPGEALHQQRMRRILGAVYQDLNFTSE